MNILMGYNYYKICFIFNLINVIVILFMKYYYEILRITTISDNMPLSSYNNTVILLHNQIVLLLMIDAYKYVIKIYF